MAMRTANFSNLLAPGQRKVWFEAFQERPTEYTSIFNIETSSRAYEDDLRVAGLTGVIEKPEGTPTQYVEATQGGTKRYTHLSYGIGYRITQEMYADDLYRVMNRMAKALARATHNAIEVLAFGILNHAFDAAPAVKYQGFDGLCLCNTAHTMVGGGGNVANRPAADVAFSATAIRNSILRFEGWTDEVGLPLLMKPKTIILDASNKFNAREILGSGFKPYTANNEINALTDEDLTYQVVHYLSTTSAWFNIAQGGLLGGVGHDMNYFWRQKPIHDTGDDFDTGDMKVKVFFRASAGFGYFYGVDGSYAA